MNILVTGANGQLGNEFRRLGEKSSNRYVFSDVSMEEGQKGIVLDITNLSELRRVMKEENIEVVVNCAAYTNVDKAESDFQVANTVNSNAVARIALACKEMNATLIHISTDYIFNGEACKPYVEKDKANPLGIYGQTKYAGEQSILTTGCKHLIFRTAWLYSKFGNNFVKTMMRLTREREKLSVVFDQVGTPTYAGDLANAIYQIIEQKLYEGSEGVYHYTNEGVCSWYDFATEIRNLSGNRCEITPCHSSEYPTPAKRPHYSVLDKTKFKQTFHIAIPYWKDSLKVCIEELKA